MQQYFPLPPPYTSITGEGEEAGSRETLSHKINCETQLLMRHPTVLRDKLDTHKLTSMSTLSRTHTSLLPRQELWLKRLALILVSDLLCSREQEFVRTVLSPYTFQTAPWRTVRKVTGIHLLVYSCGPILGTCRPPACFLRSVQSPFWMFRRAPQD